MVPVLHFSRFPISPVVPRHPIAGGDADVIAKQQMLQTLVELGQGGHHFQAGVHRQPGDVFPPVRNPGHAPGFCLRKVLGL